MKPANRFTFIVVLLYFLTPLLARNEQFHFTYLTTDDGLSQSNITCITQDSKGFMWFGTFNGLNKYNGYTFEVFNYHFDDSNSISHNYISSIAETHDGYLWVGTSDGLNRFDPNTNGFKSYRHIPGDPHSLSDNQVEAIIEDDKKRLWIATRNGGLDLYNPKRESFNHYEINKQEKSNTDFITVLFEDSKENLWIAYRDGTIHVLNEKRAKTEKYLLEGSKLTEYPITAIVESNDQNIWIATQGDGLYRILYENGISRIVNHYPKGPQTKNLLSSDIILTMLIDSENKLWIGHEDSGISLLDIATGTFQYVNHNPFMQSSLNHNSVWSIFEDRAESVWVGTFAHGVNFLNAREAQFQHIKHNPGNENGLSHDMINSFAEDEKENLWVATDGGGLNVYDTKSKKFSSFNSKNSNISSDIILTLFIDSRDRFWLGTWADGLFQFNKATKTFTQFTIENSGLSSNRILHIEEDEDDGLWLGTFWGGLTYFHPDHKKVEVYNSQNSALGDDDVRVVKRDFSGSLWIGTNVGLDLFNPADKTFINYQHSEDDKTTISKGFVHSVIQSKDSSIWIGTATGLNKFDRKTGSFIHFATNNRFPDEEIKAIIEDDDQILWLSTNNGLSRFDPKSAAFKKYDFTDGLQGNEFNARSAYKTSNGEIVFGGNNGYNIFKPGQLQTNTFIPPVILTGFNIFNKPVIIDGEIIDSHINETSTINLSYQHTAFSFEFAALNYISSGKNQYAYMMEGFDSGWNYVGQSRTASYTNLAPGHYIFKVKGSNNDGLWNETGKSVEIQIAAPYWQTWWAYLLEILLIISVIGFLLNYYTSRQRLKNALKIEHLELNKMYEMDLMKTRFFNNIAHEFNSPMTLILGPLEKLLSSVLTNESVKNSLSLMYRNVKRMQRMTDQLTDFQKIETGELRLELSKGNIIAFINDIARSFNEYAVEHHIHYHFSSETDNLVTWFDPDKLDKIIYNLLSNAFKFTLHDGEISLKISTISSAEKGKIEKEKDEADRHLKIIIEDSGIGIPEDSIKYIFERHYRVEDHYGLQYKGSGLGLAFVNELIRVYGGTISVESKEGSGSKFTLLIPIDEHYLEEHQLVKKFIPTALNDFDNPIVNKNFQVEAAVKEPGVNDIPSVLIAEDDIEIKNYLISSLGKKYRVFTVANGKEGFEKAVQLIPDLIISDIKMPVVDGIQYCNQVKADEKTSHIPIILLTGYSSKEYKIEGLKTGADVYLSKPFNIDELQAHIDNLLETRKKLRKKFTSEIFGKTSKGSIKNIDEKFIERLMETIDRHMADSKFNADTLSKEVGMSRMQLYRKLRGLTDQTVHEFIRNIRLKKAAQLLEEKSMTITEAAFEVGFNDLTYFARCFRKLYKKSPSEYLAGSK